jgi:hypothetical protein
MTLEQYTYLAEIAGVVAVIFSLIYVGKQIKQNANAMKMNAMSIHAQQVSQIQIAMATNREFAECWTKGASEFDGLDEVDKNRLLVFEETGINLWRTFFDLHRQGLLEEGAWEQQLNIIKVYTTRSSVRAAWELFGRGFNEPFRRFIDGYMD